ncbi:MAG TPA: hypothetical protein VK281_03195, partial [Xanthobacteraceae bacterium]|nr:hypothetical protein [Xanthobacteraceae bacterium]
MGERIRLKIALPALTLALALTTINRASGEGAIAQGVLGEGLPSDIAKFGVAWGFSYNYKTEAEAKVRAMDECAKSPAPEPTQKKCKIVKEPS